MKTFAIISSILAGATGLQVTTKRVELKEPACCDLWHKCIKWFTDYDSSDDSSNDSSDDSLMIRLITMITYIVASTTFVRTKKGLMILRARNQRNSTVAGAGSVDRKFAAHTEMHRC